MKAVTKIFFVFGLALFLGVFFTSDSFSQQQPKGTKAGRGFVDLNADGINDNAIDSDGDGIINCLDPDFVRPMDGTGRKLMKGSTSKTGKGGYGPANGTGNIGVGPQNGTGFGPGGTSGNCDGTGPKGKRGGRK